MNEKPVEDLMEALDLLCARWNDGTKRRLINRPGVEPYIEVEIYRDGCSGGDSWNSEYYKTAASVLKELSEKFYLDGTPCWGYTDNTKLVVNTPGRNAWRQYCQEQEDSKTPFEEPRNKYWRLKYPQVSHTENK